MCISLFLSSLFHWSVSIFVPITVLVWLLCLCSIVWSQGAWYLQFCYQDFFGYSGSSVVPQNFKIIFSISVKKKKKANGILVEIASDLYIALDRMYFNSILPIPKHGISFQHLCLYFFIIVLLFSGYMSITSLVNLFLGIFFLIQFIFLIFPLIVISI